MEQARRRGCVKLMVDILIMWKSVELSTKVLQAQNNNNKKNYYNFIVEKKNVLTLKMPDKLHVF